MAASTTSLNVPVTANTVDFQKGMADAQKYLTNFVSKAKEVGGATNGFSTAMQKMGVNAKTLQTNVKNSAFQIQDLAVQVASGTSATRALAQQLPQLLSGFGLFGALAGTAAAVLIPLASNMFTAGKNAKTFEQSLKDLKGASSEYLGSLRDVKEALSDPAWSNTAFGKMMIDANKVLEQVALTKFRDELKATAQSIATEFGQIQGSIASTNDVVKGIDAKLLKSVDGLKEVRNQYRGAAADIKGFYIAINSNGDVFLNMVKGLRNYGVEANKAAQLTKAFMDAIKSGDPKAVAVAVDALNKQIELTGVAAGKSKEEIAAQQQQLAALAAQMGGVISTSASLQGAWAKLGAQAVTTASQISTLVAQMSQLNLVGAASTWETIKSTYTSSGAAGVVNSFTKEFTANLQTNAKAVQAQRDAVLDSIDPTRALNREKERLNQLAKDGVISETELAAAIDKLSASAGGGGRGGGGGGKGGGAAKAVKDLADNVKGAGKALKDTVKPAEEFAKSLQSIAEGALNDLVDGLFSIMDGSKKAGEVFRDMAKKMLQDITKLIFQMMILKPLMASLGGVFGGGAGLFGGGTMSMASRSSIGPSLQNVPRNTLGSYSGFSQGVAVSPAAMQAMVRSSLATSSAVTAPAAPPQITVNNNSDAAVKVRYEQSRAIIDIALSEVATHITRGGNPIDMAMQRAYSARRTGY